MKMFLKINAFERFAKRNGYKNGYALIKELGCRAGTYTYLKDGGKISPDLVAEIYNRFGDDAMFEVIDFEEAK
jgi:hypothetical protein